MPNEAEFLRQMHIAINEMEGKPRLHGLVDNGDGTLRIHQPIPYSSGKPEGPATTTHAVIIKGK
jgi:hypothetical protein